MSKQRRTFTEEFKQEAVKLTRQPGAGKAAIARDLGIGVNLLARCGRARQRHPQRRVLAQPARRSATSSKDGGAIGSYL